MCIKNSVNKQKGFEKKQGQSKNKSFETTAVKDKVRTIFYIISLQEYA